MAGTTRSLHAADRRHRQLWLTETGQHMLDRSVGDILCRRLVYCDVPGGESMVRGRGTGAVGRVGERRQ